MTPDMVDTVRCPDCDWVAIEARCNEVIELRGREPIYLKEYTYMRCENPNCELEFVTAQQMRRHDEMIRERVRL